VGGMQLCYCYQEGFVNTDYEQPTNKKRTKKDKCLFEIDRLLPESLPPKGRKNSSGNVILWIEQLFFSLAAPGYCP